MSKPTDLLTALTHLRSLIQSGKPPSLHYGICSWLMHETVVFHSELLELCHKWPECLYETDGTYEWKSYCYPVVKREQYIRDKLVGTTWSNPRRLEFIDWAIEHLSK